MPKVMPGDAEFMEADTALRALCFIGIDTASVEWVVDSESLCVYGLQSDFLEFGFLIGRDSNRVIILDKSVSLSSETPKISLATKPSLLFLAIAKPRNYLNNVETRRNIRFSVVDISILISK